MNTCIHVRTYYIYINTHHTCANAHTRSYTIGLSVPLELYKVQGTWATRPDVGRFLHEPDNTHRHTVFQVKACQPRSCHPTYPQPKCPRFLPAAARRYRTASTPLTPRPLQANMAPPGPLLELLPYVEPLMNRLRSLRALTGEVVDTGAQGDCDLFSNCNYQPALIRMTLLKEPISG